MELIPKKREKTVAYNIRIKPSLLVWFRNYAKQHGVYIQDVFMLALNNFKNQVSPDE